MARWLLAAAAGLIVALPATREAQAYERDGRPLWPSRTVRYHSLSPEWRDEASAAAWAWNHSGARVRLVSSSRSRAQILVTPPRRSACGGFALTRYSSNRRLSSTIVWGARCPDRLDVIRVLVHELGHALGLGHERRRCATMNTHLVDGVPALCKREQNLPPGRRYCALLEVDDARGMTALYGGRPRLPKPRICTEPQPPAPGGLSVAVEQHQQGSAQVRFSWNDPPAPTASVRLVLRRDACPSGPDDRSATALYAQPTTAGAAREVNRVLASGRWCAALYGVGASGVPSRPATSQVVVG